MTGCCRPDCEAMHRRLPGLRRLMPVLWCRSRDGCCTTRWSPQGHFSIQDLDSSVRGRLDVEVIEQNGRKKTFQVDTASVPYLTRPGQVRYKLVSGRSRGYGHETEGPVFATGEASWGSVTSGRCMAGLCLPVIIMHWQPVPAGTWVCRGPFPLISRSQ